MYCELGKVGVECMLSLVRVVPVVVATNSCLLLFGKIEFPSPAVQNGLDVNRFGCSTTTLSHIRVSPPLHWSPRRGLVAGVQITSLVGVFMSTLRETRKVAVEADLHAFEQAPS